MKDVYIIYAGIPNYLWEIKMKYIIDESRYITSGKEYDYDGKKRYFIYAWTSNKKYLNEFKYFRNNAFKTIYKIKKVKMDKVEYSQFKYKYKDEKLEYREIPSNDNEYYGTNDYVKVLCTDNESMYTIDEGHVYLYNYLSEIIGVNYTVFDEKYINALDSLGYCDEYNIIKFDCSDDPDIYSENYELSTFNASFELTGLGNHKLIDLYANKFAIFVNLFYEMIEGYDYNNDIKMALEYI